MTTSSQVSCPGARLRFDPEREYRSVRPGRMPTRRNFSGPFVGVSPVGRSWVVSRVSKVIARLWLSSFPMASASDFPIFDAIVPRDLAERGVSTWGRRLGRHSPQESSCTSTAAASSRTSTVPSLIATSKIEATFGESAAYRRVRSG